MISFTSLYIYALILFAVKNLNIYQTNAACHGMNIRQQNKLHIPSERLSSIQRGSTIHLLKYSATTKYIKIL
jgi:hypothetical protein